MLERKKLWKYNDISVKRLFLQSDGASNEYKSANAFTLLKGVAKDYNLAIILTSTFRGTTRASSMG